MVYKKACDEMKEIKEAMQSVINEIGYWVFLFVVCLGGLMMQVVFSVQATSIQIPDIMNS